MYFNILDRTQAAEVYVMNVFLKLLILPLPCFGENRKKVYMQND